MTAGPIEHPTGYTVDPNNLSKGSLIPDEQHVLERGWNMMLVSPHGTGKSTAVREMCERHGLKLQVFNCSTMDPYTDLVGIPMPRMVQTGLGMQKEVLSMIRPTYIDEADVVFFDELNRGEPAILNAVMELVVDRRINGIHFPNIKAVFAAINPPNDDHGYQVQELDPALMDRWHQFVNIAPEPSAAWMTKKMGKAAATAAVKWWKDQNHARREAYISPRRLVMACDVAIATRDRRSLERSMPPGVVADTGKLFAMLMEAIGEEVKVNAGDSKLAATGQATTPAAPKGDELVSPITPTMTGKPAWLDTKGSKEGAAKAGSSVMRMNALAKYSAEDIRSVLAGMSQPTRWRFAKSFAELVEAQSDAKSFGNIIAAVNATTRQNIPVPQ